MAFISNWAFKVFSTIEECEVKEVSRIHNEITITFKRDDNKTCNITMSEKDLNDIQESFIRMISDSVEKPFFNHRIAEQYTKIINKIQTKILQITLYRKRLVSIQEEHQSIEYFENA